MEFESATMVKSCLTNNTKQTYSKPLISPPNEWFDTTLERNEGATLGGSPGIGAFGAE